MLNSTKFMKGAPNMFEDLFSSLTRVSDFESFRKEYANEDRMYLRYVFTRVPEENSDTENAA